MLPVQRKRFRSQQRGRAVCVNASAQGLPARTLVLLVRPSVRSLHLCLSGSHFPALLSPMHSLISLIFPHSRIARSPPGLSYSHLCPSFSSVSENFFFFCLFLLFLLLHHSQLPFPALAPLPALPVTGIGSRWVFLSVSLLVLRLHVSGIPSCSSFHPTPPPLLPPLALLPLATGAVLVRIGTIHARLFRQRIECRGCCLCAAV